MNKNGAIEISFGFLFSVILIAIFIGVAIYAIKNFMSFKKCTEVLMFKNDLQDKVDEAFASSGEVMYKINFTIPYKIELVCFLDKSKGGEGKWKNLYGKLSSYSFENKNVYFWPLNAVCEGEKAFTLKNINITKITEQNNPYCIENRNGIIEIKIEKGFYDSLVSLG